MAHHTIRGAAKRRARPDETSALFKAQCWRERTLVYNRNVAVGVITAIASKKIFGTNRRSLSCQSRPCYIHGRQSNRGTPLSYSTANYCHRQDLLKRIYAYP